MFPFRMLIHVCRPCWLSFLLSLVVGYWSSSSFVVFGGWCFVILLVFIVVVIIMGIVFVLRLLVMVSVLSILVLGLVLLVLPLVVLLVLTFPFPFVRGWSMVRFRTLPVPFRYTIFPFPFRFIPCSISQFLFRFISSVCSCSYVRIPVVSEYIPSSYR